MLLGTSTIYGSGRLWLEGQGLSSLHKSKRKRYMPKDQRPISLWHHVASLNEIKRWQCIFPFSLYTHTPTYMCVHTLLHPFSLFVSLLLHTGVEGWIILLSISSCLFGPTARTKVFQNCGLCSLSGSPLPLFGDRCQVLQHNKTELTDTAVLTDAVKWHINRTNAFLLNIFLSIVFQRTKRNTWSQKP